MNNSWTSFALLRHSTFIVCFISQQTLKEFYLLFKNGMFKPHFLLHRKDTIKMKKQINIMSCFQGYFN